MRVWNSLKYAPVDIALSNKYSVDGLCRIYETARMCINAQPLARPAMNDVATMVREAAAFPVRVVPLLERRHSEESVTASTILDELWL